MTKRLLVASDLSPGSDEALRQINRFALATGAQVAVCHVFPDSFGLSPFFAPKDSAAAATTSRVRQRVLTLLTEQARSLLRERDPELIIEQGNPYAGILRVAEDWRADLIAVGSHGRTALPRLHLGSIAEQVLRHAHCSVLVARHAEPSGVVLAATDLSEPSTPAVAAASEEARRRGATLEVAHAVDFGSVATSLEELLVGGFHNDDHWNIDAEIRESVVAQLKQALARCGATGKTHIIRGPAAAAVVRLADELKAELLVIGTRGHTGLARLGLGSVADRIVRTAGCSVLAVRFA